MTDYRTARAKIYEETTDTIRELFDRKSVRAFTDREISREEKQQILYAAMEAPSAGCQQLYTILDITDPELKERLAVTCDNQPFIAEAPMVLVFCADCRKWQECYLEADCDPRTPGVGDLMLAVTDTAIAAQNAVCAAWSLGIGSCYIGDILEQCEEHRALLHLPSWVLPAVMVVFGYPTKQQEAREKPLRFDEKQTVFEDTYPESFDCREMLKTRCGNQSYEEWTGKFCDRKYNSDFSREMTRSVGKYLKDFE